MATERIPFTGGESPSVDELAGGVPAQTNLLTDAAGALRLRPGISAWSGFPATIPNASPVIAIGIWTTYVIYVTDDRKIWAVDPAGVVHALSSDSILGTKLTGTNRPVITALRDRVVISGGGTTMQWTGGGLAHLNSTGGVSFTHIQAIAQRLVGNANDPSGILYWSDIGAYETWPTGLNFAEAETKPDPVVGLYVCSNELVALGTETITMLSPDPSVVFSPARTIDVGWGPAHSYIGMDEQFMGLDARNRVLYSNGRGFDIVSTPFIGQQLEDAGTSIADAWGMRYKVGNYNLGILNLPTDGRSFVYDTDLKQWGEWRGWDADAGQFGKFGITASCYHPTQKVTLVGLATGQIAMLDQAAYTDLGQPIAAQATSTFVDHNSSRSKKCNGVRVRFRRGVVADGDAGYLLLSYRDDLGEFCEPFRVDIGDSSDVAPVVQLRSLGTYRQRQWRVLVDSVAFRFASLEEDWTLLDS